MSISRPARTLEDLERTVRAIAASPPARFSSVLYYTARESCVTDTRV